MLSDKTKRNTSRRNDVARAIAAFKHTDAVKLIVEYLNLSLDSRLNVLLSANGEEAIALRGELRNIKALLALFDNSDAPFTDSIN